MIKTLLYMFSFLSIFAGCKSANKGDSEPSAKDESTEWAQMTKMQYRFVDSSLPPDYHRSYTIVITESEITISIDSYGDELLSRQYPNNSTSFSAFVEKLSEQGIRKKKKKADNACTGGTTESLQLYKDNDCFFDGYVYHCDGDNGTMSFPYEAKSLICSQIPEDVELLIESTRTN